MKQNYCYSRSEDKTVSTVTRQRAEWSLQRQEIVLFPKTSELVLKLTQGMRQNTHHHPVPTLRMNGSMYPLPH